MPELIDKHAAYKALKHEADTHILPEYKEAYERAARIIDQMKPEERHGRWIEGTSQGSYSIYCSYCGSHKETICPSNYCPNCGARMGGDEYATD